MGVNGMYLGQKVIHSMLINEGFFVVERGLKVTLLKTKKIVHSNFESTKYLFTT